MAKASSRHKSGSRPRGTGPGGKLLKEIFGLALIAAGIVITLALASYDAKDPSWSYVGERISARNWIGPAGAKLADGLYQTFGWAALLLPFVFFALAWWRLRELRVRLSWLKIFGLGLLLVSLTGLLAIAEPGKPGGPFHLGGWVGHVLVYGDGRGNYGLASFVNRTGSAIVLALTFLTGFMIATNFSLVGLLVQLTPHEREAGVAAALGERFRRWREQRMAERERRAAEAKSVSSPAPSAQPIIEHKSQAERKAEREPESSPPVIAPLATPATIAKARSEEAAAKERAVEEGERLSTPAVETAKAAEAEASNTGAARAQTAARASAGAAPSRAPARPASTGASRRGADAPTEEDELDELDADDLATEEAKAGSGQMSVEEMLATASVKRTETAEEKPRPESRAGRLVKNILRTAAEYKLPSTEMLTPPAPPSELADAELMERARQLAEKCREFNVSGQVKHISPGPVVTTFEFKPDPGVKYSRVTSLVDDLCLGLKAESIRIDRIPGKSTVGIEVPNQAREIIRIREVIESKKFRESESKLTLALGKTIDGANYVAELTKMPHLLIAGATGAGKSVALNAILVSLLYKATPDEVKMILVDPKRLELGLYADIPHLLTPIVTDPKRASYTLKWAVGEMEMRYKHLAAFGVRNIEQYNNEVCATVDRNLAEDSEELPKPLPYIVVIIDELADLMMVSARDVEESITRLAQMARAVGIHLVLATQRPSVDVITGLIKANFPSRISFRVSSKVDSRTIIDANGAEALLGQGDMLFLPPGTSRLIRVHGAFVDEKEVKRIADHARAQAQPAYDDKVQMSDKEIEGEELSELKRDEKYDDALRIVIEMGRASTSVLQRRLRIGYGRAASIIDMMYREGIVGPEDGSKPRQVLVKSDFLERLDQMREE
jgi:S-DNA-T family DNA segregation ATPase FtsK/SpoIIIE